MKLPPWALLVPMTLILCGCTELIRSAETPCESHDTPGRCDATDGCRSLSGEVWDLDTLTFGPSEFIACVDATSCSSERFEPIIVDRDGTCLRTTHACDTLDALIVTPRDDTCQNARFQAVDCEAYTFDECDRSDFCNTLHAARRRGDCLSYEPLFCMSNDRNCQNNQIASKDQNGVCWLIQPPCTPSGWPGEPEEVATECEEPLRAPICD